MSNYVFLGAPGAGKGTMAALLNEQFGIVHISTGDMLRAEIQQGSPLGSEVKRHVEAGSLVPDGVVAAIVGQRLQKADVARNGFVLDGYPRTLVQAELLAAALTEHKVVLDAVILLEADDDLLLRRLTSRRVCGACGAVYNVISNPAQRDGVCDKCGGKLNQRVDDSRATAIERLAVYARETAPLIEFYESRGLLLRVSGSAEKNKNFAALCAALELA